MILGAERSIAQATGEFKELRRYVLQDAHNRDAYTGVSKGVGRMLVKQRRRFPTAGRAA